MWNSATTDAFPSITTDNVTMKGHGGADVNAYFVRPQGQGPFPGIVLVHHMPGWDEFYREFARRFADHGYLVICPNLYSRFGQGSPDALNPSSTATHELVVPRSIPTTFGMCPARIHQTRRSRAFGGFYAAGALATTTRAGRITRSGVRYPAWISAATDPAGCSAVSSC